MYNVILVGPDDKGSTKTVVFVGGKSTEALTVVPAKQWPFTVFYSSSDTKNREEWERGISEFIVDNNHSLGCLIWDPIPDYTIIKHPRLGTVYNSKFNAVDLASTILE